MTLALLFFSSLAAVLVLGFLGPSFTNEWLNLGWLVVTGVLYFVALGSGVGFLIYGLS